MELAQKLGVYAVYNTVFIMSKISELFYSWHVARVVCKVQHY